MGRRQLRFFLFCMAGMGVCLLSAYINTFLAAVCQADALAATAEIAPVVEEMMKLLPLVFYLLVFEPEGIRSRLPPSRLPSPSPPLKTCAISSRTAQTASPSSSSVASARERCRPLRTDRGRRAGVYVAADVAEDRRHLRSLGAAITLHAIYNLLIAYGGAAQYIAYALPVLLIVAGKLSAFRLSRRK